MLHTSGALHYRSTPVMFLNMHTCDVCGDEDVRHALLEVRDDPVAVVLVELAVDARDCTRTRAEIINAYQENENI
jgi:hypothetical protein